jgi:hypothetical protein
VEQQVVGSLLICGWFSAAMRLRPSRRKAMKPARYISPYQWMASGPSYGDGDLIVDERSCMNRVKLASIIRVLYSENCNRPQIAQINRLKTHAGNVVTVQAQKFQVLD